MVLAAEGYPDTVRKGDAIAGLDAAAQLPGKVFHAGTKAEGTARWSRTAAACCARWAWATPCRRAQAQAYALVDAISWPGMQCRRDIGYRAIEREKSAKI